MKNFLTDFKAFLMKGNLVVLAVAFLMATAFAPVVTAFANNVVMNLIAAIFGKPNFDSIGFYIGDGEQCGLTPVEGVDCATFIGIGSVITALITFLIIALVCFVLLKAYERVQKKDEEETPAGPTEIELLTEIRDSLRNS
jgi:large conductance mechanosensitive channel